MKKEKKKKKINYEDLKCCGNCAHYKHTNNTCNQPYEFGTREGWEVCEKWKFDDLTQKNRIQEEYNGH